MTKLFVTSSIFQDTKRLRLILARQVVIYLIERNSISSRLSQVKGQVFQSAMRFGCDEKLPSWLSLLGIIILVVGGTVAGLGGSSGTLIGGIVILIVGIALAANRTCHWRRQSARVCIHSSDK